MNKKYLLAAAASTLMFTACGDDVTEVNEIHQDGMAVLEAGEKLSKQACDTTNVGEMLFVMDSSAAFVCDGKSWQTLKGENGGKGNPGKDGDNGTGCTSKSVKNKSGLEGLEVTCGETVIDTVWNGKDGQNGNNGTSCTAESVTGENDRKGVKVTCGGDEVGTIWDGSNGSNGTNGTSCTAEPVTADDGRKGVKVTCGGDEVGTIWDGTNGSNGTNGTSCSLEDDGEGSVSVTCGEGEGATTTTIFKAMCGMKPYDPAKLFCSDGELYSCNDKPYDPAKSFCLEGELYDLCDGKTYDPAKSFCSEGELYSCNDKPYDPKKQYCLKVTRNGTDIYSVEDLLTDSRDKHVYKTVEICNTDKSVCQTWMAENLNYADSTKTPSLKGKSWCYGEGTLANEEVAANCTKYGRLYTWAAAIDSVALANDVDDSQICGDGKTCTLPTVVQGVCPEGWHLPTDAEWVTLFTAVGGFDIAGKMLKSQTDWNDNENGEDAYGFSALPAGRGKDGGNYSRANSVGRRYGYFWSATQDEVNSNYALYNGFFSNIEGVVGDCFNKDYAISVRCLRDN